MTTAAVLTLCKTAKVFVDVYVTNTRGLTAEEAVAMVRVATTVDGDGPGYVLDGIISITVDADGISVLGIGR